MTNSNKSVTPCCSFIFSAGCATQQNMSKAVEGPQEVVLCSCAASSTKIQCALRPPVQQTVGASKSKEPCRIGKTTSDTGCPKQQNYSHTRCMMISKHFSTICQSSCQNQNCRSHEYDCRAVQSVSAGCLIQQQQHHQQQQAAQQHPQPIQLG